MEKNFGLIIEEPKDTDYILGDKKIPTTILQKDGQWGDFLPAFEAQKKKIETMACVSFSALNCLETLHNRLFNEKINKSDRFLARMSHTGRNGNSMRNVAESVRKDGIVKESLWSYENITSWSQYYKTIPNSIIRKGKDWLKEYSVRYDWIYDSGLSIAQKQNRLMEALQYSPIQVSVYAYGRQKGGIFIEENRRHNHAIIIYGYKKGYYWKLFDSYKNEFKKFAWNYNFHYSLRFNLTKLNKKTMLELYKDFKTTTVYIKGEKGDGLFHPILSEKFVFDLFGDWDGLIVNHLNKPLDKNEIGCSVGTAPFFINMITNLFKK